jgi:hypothetical protein
MAVKKVTKKTTTKTKKVSTSSKAKSSKAKSSKAKSSKAKSKNKKIKDRHSGDGGIVVVEDDIVIDQDKINEERRAYLEESRSQEASD